MHFDDRLATVLRLPAAGEAMARNQYLQLVDILGTLPADVATPTVAAGVDRIAQLAAHIPGSDRARLLERAARPITSTRLLALLAEHEPDVACAAIARARLTEAEWLALVPALPVRARGILRHRRDLAPAVETLLERLGVHDRGLPDATQQAGCDAGQVPEHAHPSGAPGEELSDAPTPTILAPTRDLAADQDISPDVFALLDLANAPPPPTSLSEWARARAAQQREPVASTPDSSPATTVTPPATLSDVAAGIAPRFPSRAASRTTARTSGSEAGIGALVRRIEEFRRSRAPYAVADIGADAPRLPLGDVEHGEIRLAQAIDFATDTHGTLVWADGAHAPSVVGLSLTPGDEDDGHRNGHLDDAGAIAEAVRQRLPLRCARLILDGAPTVAGLWQIDAVPRFESGRFGGYVGRLRRIAPTVSLAAPAPASEGDRLREVLHELRTPANAIQVAAEIIQQQLYGPAPHEYRALAAAIAGDCAHILAGFEDLERLARLETGALALEEGTCDLAEVLELTIARLHAWTQPRGSGFMPDFDLSDVHMPIAVERGEAERLVWRVFAALAGSMAPGEILALSYEHDGDALGLTIALPSALVARDPGTMFEGLSGDRSQSLATGMFGLGFTLRLAAAEAAAAGGGLSRAGDVLRLALPALTAVDAGNSAAAGGAI